MSIPVHFKNNQNYSGYNLIMNGFEVHDITTQEYNDLPEADKMSDVYWNITDADDPYECKSHVFTVNMTGLAPASGSTTFSRTFTNSSITGTMKVVGYVLSNPSAQIGDWSWTIDDGYVTVSGSISGTTDLTMDLMERTVLTDESEV